MMVTHDIVHGLSEGQSKKAAKRAFAHYADKYEQAAAKIAWNGDGTARVSFQVLGIPLKGTARFCEGVLRLELDLPVYLVTFKSLAISVIDKEARKWIEM